MPQLQTAGGGGKQRRRNVERAVESRRAEDDFVGPPLGVFDQFLEGFVGLLIIDNQHAGIGHETRDGNKVGARELRRTTEQLIDFGETGDRGDVEQQRVAVRLGIGDELCADGPCGAGFGFDHHRLLHHRLHHRGERAADHIRGATRRERIDQYDRARRIGRILREGCLQGGRCGGGAEDEAASIHAVLPGSRRVEDAPVSCGRRC